MLLMSCKKKKRPFKKILKSRGPITDPCSTLLIKFSPSTK